MIDDLVLMRDGWERRLPIWHQRPLCDGFEESVELPTLDEMRSKEARRELWQELHDLLP